MLYTGNVNRALFWIVIPFLLSFYVVFRICEWVYLDDGNRHSIAEQHAKNLSTDRNINCIILGGSNAVFSLSAEQITANTDLSCYNLSLLNEGYSDHAYSKFIDSMTFDKEEIKIILYSSVLWMNREAFEERLIQNEHQTSISGDKQFSLVGRSIASYIKQWLFDDRKFWASSKQYPLPNTYGDFDFNGYDGCKTEAINKQNWELVSDVETLTNWVENKVAWISKNFRDADIHLVIPSTLNLRGSDTNYQNLGKFLSQIVQNRGNNEKVFKVIVQPPFESEALLCDGIHHANAVGRKKRTEDLIENLPDNI